MRADARRNRETVMEAGARLLAARPQATMQDIADASGLGRTTVYRHFRAREELVRALVEQVASEAQAGVEAAMSVEGGALEGLQRLATDMFSLGRRYAFLRAQRDEVRDEMVETDRAFTDWVGRAQERGELRDDMTAAWIVSGARGLVTAAIDDANHLGDPDGVVRALRETLVAAFGPRG